MNTYENFEFEDEFETKDAKKGAKDAKKALKKLDCLSKDNIQDLIDATFNRTTNGEYLTGYCSICRQAITQLVNVA